MTTLYSKQLVYVYVLWEGASFLCSRVTSKKTVFNNQCNPRCSSDWLCQLIQYVRLRVASGSGSMQRLPEKASIVLQNSHHHQQQQQQQQHQHHNENNAWKAALMIKYAKSNTYF